MRKILEGLGWEMPAASLRGNFSKVLFRKRTYRAYGHNNHIGNSMSK